MKEAGISQAEMARRIPCKPSALSKLWLPQTRMSRLVPAIHRELGRPAPAMAITADEILRRINARWPSLSKEARILVDQLVDQLIAGRRE